MFKIAILGCENSHADSFLNGIIKEGRYPDVEVVGVYSNEPEALERMKNNFGVYCASSYDEFVGKVDGIMITARDGANHYKYAKPYISYGIPMFIDKPITCDVAEAKEFMRELKANGCRVTGGSTCVHAPLITELSEFVKSTPADKVYGGFLRAPISMNNAYGGFFFYAQHLTEVMMKIFGYYPKSVVTDYHSTMTTVLVKYEDRSVCAEYIDGVYKYSAFVSTDTGVKGGEYPVTSDLYVHELDSFYKLLHGDAGRVDLKEFIAPVALISAIEKSIRTGKEVEVEAVDI